MSVDLDSRTLSPRRLSREDVAAALELSNAAGWNQTSHDWAVMIEHGEGFCFVDPDERLVATAILLPWRQRVDWVSMMLVREEWRGRGVGTRLMRLLVELSVNPTVGLDATPFGRSMYENLGFAAVERITRYELAAADAVDMQHRLVTQLDSDDFGALLAHFGVDISKRRLDIYRALVPQASSRVLLSREEKPVGIAIARHGRNASHIGPVYATDAAAATNIVEVVVQSTEGPAIIDVPARHSAFCERLSKMGFEPTRSFDRMFRRGLPNANPSEYAIAGPEFG